MDIVDKATSSFLNGLVIEKLGITQLEWTHTYNIYIAAIDTENSQSNCPQLSAF